MRIAPGALAPDFETVDLFGNQINLLDYRGKVVLLSFFRNAACALCNLRIHTLIEHYQEYRDAGLEILAVFESSAAAMRAYVGRQDAPFALIADPQARLYDLYRVENSEEKLAATMASATTAQVVAAAAAQGFPLTQEAGSNMERMPADFLIGADGQVIAAQYAAYVWDHLPLAMIEDVLRAAQPA